MKVDYTLSELDNMTVRELRRLLGKLNTEARTRAKSLKSHGYSGKMASPDLIAVRGLKKNELKAAILDNAVLYLKNPRSKISGMKRFEREVVSALKENYNVKIPRSRLSDFIEYLDEIKDLWGSLKYPSKYSVQLYEEMNKSGLTSDDIVKGFKNYLKSESGILDLKEGLKEAKKEARKQGVKEVSSDILRSVLGKK